MKKIFPVLFLIIFLGACATPTPAPVIPTATEAFAPQVTPVINPISANTPVKAAPATTSTPQAELVRISGTGPGESQPFTLTAETKIRVNFKTLSDERIQVRIVSLDPNQTDPRYMETAYATTYNPTEGFTDNTLVAGPYKVVVLTDGGAWEVWVETLTQ